MTEPKSRRRTHRSRGELISTFTFAVVGLFFAGEASVLWEEGAQGKAILIGGCALMCFAGALRFHIHNLLQKLRELRR